jgi:hypothetical protein
VKTRRNEPCPCGSGKKYKKCCLKKEEQAHREAALKARTAAQPAAVAPPVARQPAREPDPQEEALERLWTEFEKGDYERKIALFTESLGDEELMDADFAFEMLNQIEPEAVRRSEQDRFDALVEAARERRPEIYAQNVGYWGGSLITNALVAGRFERVVALALEVAGDPASHIDAFERTLEQLAFHNQHEALLETHRTAWPKIAESDEVMGWAIARFGNRTIDYEVFDYLERSKDPSPDDPDLRRRLEAYEDLRFELVAESVRALLGRADRDWTTVDFEMPRRGRGRWVVDEDEEDEDEVDELQKMALGDLAELSLEFLGWAHREHDVPYASGHLGREEIVEYVVERGAGDLESAPTAPRRVGRPKRRKPKREAKPETRPIHPLCPDGATLERYFAGHLRLLNYAPYRVAAAFELMPLWMRFLETQGLIGAEERERAGRELRSLGQKLVEAFGQMPEDPTLHERTASALARLEP